METPAAVEPAQYTHRYPSDITQTIEAGSSDIVKQLKKIECTEGIALDMVKPVRRLQSLRLEFGWWQNRHLFISGGCTSTCILLYSASLSLVHEFIGLAYIRYFLPLSLSLTLFPFILRVSLYYI